MAAQDLSAGFAGLEAGAYSTFLTGWCMPRVIHFEIHIDQPGRAMRFYASVFGWQFTPLSGMPVDYWAVRARDRVRHRRRFDTLSYAAEWCRGDRIRGYTGGMRS